MKRVLWPLVLLYVCLFSNGCNERKARKPDPTKGVVTGIVLCADNGKPARFATVTLMPVPRKEDKPDEKEVQPPEETTVTDLDGRFRIEAVEPGRYYAISTLEGYLDPMRGLDFTRLGDQANEKEFELDAVKQWTGHFVEVSVRVHRTAEISLQVERGAEIGGTVTFDDGSPAIGMHFSLFRKTEKNGWTNVGFRIFDNWSIPTVRHRS